MEEAANSEQSVPPCAGPMPDSASELGRDSAGMQITGPVRRGLWEPVSLLCSSLFLQMLRFQRSGRVKTRSQRLYIPHPYKPPLNKLSWFLKRKFICSARLWRKLERKMSSVTFFFLKRKRTRKKVLNIKPKTHDLDDLKTVALRT